MTRPLRLEFPGALWHVTSRGNERRDIVRDDLDRRRFARMLGKVVGDCKWFLHAWVLMSNHYHLLVETPEMGLSRGIKWLNQRYAETFNERHDRVGHLFQGRFKGILVEREGHLLELLRYIVLNPVRSGSVAFAGDYQWSNYRATAGLQPAPSWLEVKWTLDQFDGRNLAEKHDAYRRFVAEGRGASYNPWEAILGQMYLGSEAFRERMQILVDTKPRSREHPMRQRKHARVSFDVLIPLIADAFDVPHDELLRKSRDWARKALALVACDAGKLTQESIAKSLGVTEGAVSRLRKAASARYASDREFRRRIERVKSRIQT